MTREAGTHTVVLVEDQEDTRAYLAETVDSDPELVLAGQAGSVREGHRLLRAHAPDVLLTDLGLPDRNGIELIREARHLSADTLILVITVFGDEKTVLDAIEAGARGYLLKDASPPAVVDSIKEMLRGGSPISPAIARHLIERFALPPQQDGAPGPHLAKREIEVLRLITKGFSFSEIGELLGISRHTVTTHVRRIYRKLEVRSRGEAVYEAVSQGIVKME